MVTRFSRRAVLGALLYSAAGAALAEAPLRSLRPVGRPGAAPVPKVRPRARPGLDDYIAAAELGGTVALVVAGAGDPIEARAAAMPLPPASVTKAVTALYALDALGPEHRFSTRVLATGPVVDGVLDGDLILAGGGDPTLDTDHLAQMATALREGGLREVRGGFKVYAGALPYVHEIEPGQLDHLGYNPSVSGLNLNFNRVHFEWRRAGGSYSVTMDARTALYQPDVTMARMRIVDRSLPIYTYEGTEAVDLWTVARPALGDGGARWLPVRRPALYAGDVFRTMARANGIVLQAAERTEALPEARALALHDSAPLREVLRGMLKFSTNLTAEVVGLAATAARAGGVRPLMSSSDSMTDWARARFGVEAIFVDHSGLSDANRISAGAMVRILQDAGAKRLLGPILKQIPLTDVEGEAVPGRSPARAKTGTLNFVSALAGYVTGPDGTDRAFAIFCADVDRREAAKLAGDEVPPGSISWNSRAKRLQQVLLQRWSG